MERAKDSNLEPNLGKVVRSSQRNFKEYDINYVLGPPGGQSFASPRDEPLAATTDPYRNYNNRRATGFPCGARFIKGAVKGTVKTFLL